MSEYSGKHIETDPPIPIGETAHQKSQQQVFVHLWCSDETTNSSATGGSFFSSPSASSLGLKLEEAALPRRNPLVSVQFTPEKRLKSSSTTAAPSSSQTPSGSSCLRFAGQATPTTYSYTPLLFSLTGKRVVGFPCGLPHLTVMVVRCGVTLGLSPASRDKVLPIAAGSRAQQKARRRANPDLFQTFCQGSLNMVGRCAACYLKILQWRIVLALAASPS